MVEEHRKDHGAEKRDPVPRPGPRLNRFSARVKWSVKKRFRVTPNSLRASIINLSLIMNCSALHPTRLLLRYFCRIQVLVWLLLMLTQAAARSEKVRPFQSGDRICFLGDSITKGGSYHQLIELFYALRFPERSIEFLNCGIGGDRASHILTAPQFRIESDVLSHRPTVVTVMLGMNDVERRLYEPGSEERNAPLRANALKTYRSCIQTLVERLQRSGAHVILLSPSVYEESLSFSKPAVQPGINAALAACARVLQELSDEMHTDFVDVHAVMDALNQKKKKQNPSFSITGDAQSWNDRVHPGPTGHFVIAHALLSAQGCLSTPPELPLPGQRVPGFVAAEVSASLWTLSDERRRLGEELREPVSFRYAMAKEGLDPTDAGLLKWLKQKQTSIVATGRNAPWVDRALAILGKERELKERHRNLALELRQRLPPAQPAKK